MFVVLLAAALAASKQCETSSFQRKTDLMDGDIQPLGSGFRNASSVRSN
jgi:hypothetical protein